MESGRLPAKPSMDQSKYLTRTTARHAVTKLAVTAELVKTPATKPPRSAPKHSNALSAVKERRASLPSAWR
jgi:hypothetical protein